MASTERDVMAFVGRTWSWSPKTATGSCGVKGDTGFTGSLHDGFYRLAAGAITLSGPSRPPHTNEGHLLPYLKDLGPEAAPERPRSAGFALPSTAGCRE